jgi:hypothetical protein
MCDKCDDLEHKIQRCRRLLALATDQIAVDGIEPLLNSYEAEKRALHPGQN